MKRKAFIPACDVCKGTPGINVRERKPGAWGGMGQSFSSHYYLCGACLAICQLTGAIHEWRKKSIKPRRAELVTVLAKTYAWLVAMRRQRFRDTGHG
jgi:hypothetical protein